MSEEAGDARGAASAAPAPGQVAPEVLARWERDINVIQESIGLMLGNQLADAERKLAEASLEVAARDIDFKGGDHDLRGCFALVSAIMGLLNGLASLESNQLETVLQRVWAADELLALDGEWAGRTVLRGLCLLIAGVVQIMQGSVTRGVWQVLRSWLYLRYLESEGLNFEGHEQGCVRSTALLALGVFNLFASMLPPQAMRTAGWITGFRGGRDTALRQLWMCWEEGGIQAPFAGLALIGVAVDVASFLGELRGEREKRHRDARQILDWAAERYPGAFFFDGLEANYLAATCDLDGAVAKLEGVTEAVHNLPAFSFLVHVRTATLQASRFEWSRAAEAFHAAVQVHRAVGRRALCPALSLNASLCYTAAGEQEKAAEMLKLCRSYRHEKKTWARVDSQALEQAEQAAAAGDDDGAEGRPVWRPMLWLYLKICVIYRAVNFMSPKQVETFTAMVRAEADACDGDAGARCHCLFILAEAMRQSESWAEALRLAAECVALEPELPPAARKSGALHFGYLVMAYAHFALGRPGEAKEALAKLDALASEHAFQRQVEFKATHLRLLVGAEFLESYKEVPVAGRSTVRLLVDVPEGIEGVEWDWVLKDFSLNFVALFQENGSADGPRELQRVTQHQADAGPCVGRLEAPGPGRLELVFDNSFSMLRGKTVQCRVQPSSLTLRQE